MHLQVVRDGQYLALMFGDNLTSQFVIRNAFGSHVQATIPGLVRWIDSQNQIMADKFDGIGQAHRAKMRSEAELVALAGGVPDPEPRSPAFETVEDTQRRAHADELRRIAYALDQAGVPKTACGGEGDAEVYINISERIRWLARRAEYANKRRAEYANKRLLQRDFKITWVSNHMQFEEYFDTAAAARTFFDILKTRPALRIELYYRGNLLDRYGDEPKVLTGGGTRNAYSHGEAMAKMMPEGYAPGSETISEGGRVYQWENYPRDTFRKPEEWCKWFGIRLSDRNGWQGPNGQSYELLVNITEFVRRASRCAICQVLPLSFKSAYKEYVLNEKV